MRRSIEGIGVLKKQARLSFDLAALADMHAKGSYEAVQRVVYASGSTLAAYALHGLYDALRCLSVDVIC